MKLSVLTVPLYDRSLEEAMKYLSNLGVQALELGAGGYPGRKHLDPEVYLNDDNKINEVKELLKKYNLTISAISCHGNPVHPDKEKAEFFHNGFKNAILLAEKLGVDTIVGFSGCPGDCKESKNPNWVTCAWPPEYKDILEWQWNEVLIPYWKDMAEFAKSHGIKKIAFELHPGFCVYNTKSLLRMREAVGDIIGANVDPSHLIWQGMDVVEVIKELKGAIHHFHAKDTYIDKRNSSINGNLDTTDYSKLADRSWNFRTVGYGMDLKTWKDIMSTLVVAGYDGAVSIEHEDALMSIEEGLEKAIATLKEAMMFETPTDMWWN